VVGRGWSIWQIFSTQFVKQVSRHRYFVVALHLCVFDDDDDSDDDDDDDGNDDDDDDDGNDDDDDEENDVIGDSNDADDTIIGCARYLKQTKVT
jgi:hypothetical protein